MLGIELMDAAIAKATESSKAGKGGPFGAVIVDKYRNVLAVESNSVLATHDPTAHAEVNAIRAACKAIGSHDLSGCRIYTTCMPCPMCLSAIMWANIDTVYYGCTSEDAKNIGFRDDFMYDVIKNESSYGPKMIPAYRSQCMKLFDEYTEMKGEMY